MPPTRAPPHAPNTAREWRHVTKKPPLTSSTRLRVAHPHIQVTVAQVALGGAGDGAAALHGGKAGRAGACMQRHVSHGQAAGQGALWVGLGGVRGRERLKG